MKACQRAIVALYKGSISDKVYKLKEESLNLKVNVPDHSTLLHHDIGVASLMASVILNWTSLSLRHDSKLFCVKVLFTGVALWLARKWLAFVPYQSNFLLSLSYIQSKVLQGFIPYMFITKSNCEMVVITYSQRNGTGLSMMVCVYNVPLITDNSCMIHVFEMI